MKSKRQNTEYIEERLGAWQESASTDRRVFLIDLGMDIGGVAISTKIALNDNHQLR